jgi:hypothetical protein
MIHINFIASNSFDENDLKTVDQFVDTFPDFQTIVLTDKNELEILLSLMNIYMANSQTLNNTAFPEIWDISDYKLPELDESEFNIFYQKWLKKINKENDMDQYCQLIFLQGMSKKWNLLKRRLVILESS